MTVETLNSWSLTVTALGAAILWQSTLVAGLAAGVCWLLRGRAPALRYWCWQIVALKLLVMPWWVLAIPFPNVFAHDPPAAPGSSTADATHDDAVVPGVNPPAAHSVGGIQPAASSVAKDPRWLDPLGQITWRSWLVLLWFAGVCWLTVRVLVQRRRLGRLLSRTMVADDSRLLALVNDVARQLGLRRLPIVMLTDEEGSPFVCGLFRPMLVLPRALLGSLAVEQRREVLLHELAHLKRGDLWWGWVPEIASLIYFFHPVAHWVCARIRLERELACDQLAMALSGRSAADYALVLVEVVSHASLPAALIKE